MLDASEMREKESKASASRDWAGWGYSLLPVNHQLIMGVRELVCAEEGR